MSVAGIASSSFFDVTSLLGSQGKTSQSSAQSEFEQLGQDLQSGNLSAAQSDFATLQQDGPGFSILGGQTNNPIAQEFNQLSQDLQSGNLSAAQQDYSSLQQDFQSQSATGHAHGHHHHHGGGNGAGGANGINQLMNELGTALQSNNLSAAQQAYNSLAQDFPQFGQDGGSAAPAGSSATSGSFAVAA